MFFTGSDAQTLPAVAGNPRSLRILIVAPSVVLRSYFIQQPLLYVNVPYLGRLVHSPSFSQVFQVVDAWFYFVLPDV